MTLLSYSNSSIKDIEILSSILYLSLTTGHICMYVIWKITYYFPLNVNVSVANTVFYDFCGFRSVAVNSVYKLQFFTFIYIDTE